MQRTGRTIVGGFAALVLAATGIQAQQQVDSRWLPWVGCWEIVTQEEVEPQVLCVEPAEVSSSAVQLLSEAQGEVPTEILYADGQSRPVEVAGCEGTERSTFSPDGARLYITGEYLCGDGAQQEGRGVIAMTGPDEWVDIRSLTQGDETVVMVQQYRKASPEAIADAGRVELTSPRTELSRRLAASPPEVEDVVEVYRSMGPEGTQAWLMAMGQRLDLGAEELVALSEAGVEEQVIDMAIAVSYPDDFQLAPQPNTAVASVEKSAPEYRDGRRWYSPYGRRFRMTYGFWGPTFTPLGYLYDPYSYMWGSSWFWNPYYSRIGCPFCDRWGGPGWNGFGGGFGGPVVIVRGGDNGDRGRSVAGRGFTRGGSSSAMGRTGIGGGSDRSWTGSRDRTRRAPPVAGSGRTGGRSGAASSGPQRSSGGKATGRRAKPRGGGGGGL